MEQWSQRIRRTKAALLAAGIVFSAGIITLMVWLLAGLITRQPTQAWPGLLALSLLPLPYLLFYLFSSRRGFSFFRRFRLKRRLEEVPATAHPRTRALLAWDWLPFRRGRLSGWVSYSLAGEDAPEWEKLAEAGREVRLATGQGFDVLVLLEKGPLNFVAGELPGAGTWLCASRELVRDMDREELAAPLVHELFNHDTGELKARNTALDLHDLGSFASTFVIYYTCVALILFSLPTDFSVVELPLLALLVLALWVVIKALSLAALALLFPAGSRLAADAYAVHVLSGPLAVASSQLLSLRYSAGKLRDNREPVMQESYLARFMYAPLAPGKRLAGQQVERLMALKAEALSQDLPLSPELQEANRRIEEMAMEAEGLYRRARPRWTTRAAAVLAYAFLFACIFTILGIATRGNFLPVRLWRDWTGGGANQEVMEPGASGEEVSVYGWTEVSGEPSCYFSPIYATVTVGETVTWTNDSEAGWGIEGEGIPRSPLLGPGESWSVKFNRSGTCRYHAWRLDAEGREVKGASGTVSVFY